MVRTGGRAPPEWRQCDKYNSSYYHTHLPQREINFIFSKLTRTGVVSLKESHRFFEYSDHGNAFKRSCLSKTWSILNCSARAADICVLMLFQAAMTVTARIKAGEQTDCHTAFDIISEFGWIQQLLKNCSCFVRSERMAAVWRRYFKDYVNSLKYLHLRIRLVSDEPWPAQNIRACQISGSNFGW